MRSLVWIGGLLIALGLVAYVVLRVTIWVAVILFVLGLVLIVRGAVRVKQAL